MFMTWRERSGTKLPYTLFFAFKKKIFFLSPRSNSCLVRVLAEPRIQPRRGVAWDFSNRSQGEEAGMPAQTPNFLAQQGGDTEEYVRAAAGCPAVALLSLSSVLFLSAWHLINFTVNSLRRSIFDRVPLWSLGWLGVNYANQSLPWLRPEQGIRGTAAGGRDAETRIPCIDRFLEEAQCGAWLPIQAPPSQLPCPHLSHHDLCWVGGRNACLPF